MDSKKIEKNREKVLEMNENYKIFTKELIEFLGDEYFLAPASASLDLYNCCPGGLVAHSLIIAKYAVNLNNLLPDKVKIPIETLIKVSFLSQIGKAFLYVNNETEWEIRQGKIYTYNDLTPMTIGERSLMYAMRNGVILSDDEYQAILYSDKDDYSKISKFLLSPLTQIIRMAFQLSIIQEKSKNAE